MLGMAAFPRSAAGVPSPENREKIESLRKTAIAGMQDGDYGEAIHCFRACCDLDPQNPLVYKDLLWAMIQAGHVEEVGAVARRILELRPQDHEGLDALARVPNEENRRTIGKLYRARIGKSPDSLPLYRQLLALAPAEKAASMLHHLISGLHRMELFSEGLEAAGYLVKTWPADFESWNFLGRMQDSLETYQEAVASYQKSLQLNSQQPMVYAYLARLYVALGDLEQAKQYRQNRDSVVQVLKGFRHAGRFSEGLEIADYLVQLHPEDPESWIWLGRMQSGMADYKAALASYRKSLELNSRQPVVKVAIARTYMDICEFEQAKQVCQEMESAGELPDSGYPILASALYCLGEFEESLRYWEKAAAVFPDSTIAPYYEAMTLAILGRVDQARKKMTALYDKHGEYRALMFLVEQEEVQGNTLAAIALLEERFVETEDLRLLDDALLMRLAELYALAGVEDQPEMFLKQVLQDDPDNQSALYYLAQAAYDKRDWEAGESYCRRLLKSNPGMELAYLMLGEIAAARGQTREADQYRGEYISRNPNEPEVVFASARAVYDSGRKDEARSQVFRWLSENRGEQVLPVLLYHGLAVSEHDPMLAYSYHNRLDVFEDHMRALSEAGYTPVTMKEVDPWLAGQADLPERPVLITFDDGRIDSFLRGDPILEKYGMKAVMFSALCNTDTRPGYMNLTRMREYQETGRWDIQSHGDRAHVAIPVNSEGKAGLFLLNRCWLEKDGRLEEAGEWQQRIADDYRSSRDILLAAMGSTPTAYAFPQGAWGQNDARSNALESASRNQEIIRQYFTAAFKQDKFGMNLRTQNHYRLTRLEPPDEWRGEDLVDYYRNQNPFARAYATLLEWAAREGRVHEARRWLAELERIGVTPGELAYQEARIQLAGGDLLQAEAFARRAVALERVSSAQQMADELTAEGRVGWNPETYFEQDNYGRRYWFLEQSLEVGRSGDMQWCARYRHGEFVQSQVPAAVDNAGGLSVRFPVGLFHKVWGEFMVHSFSGEVRNTYSLRAAVRSNWADDFKTQFRIERAPYNTLMALNREITAATANLQLDWSDRSGAWQASSRGIWSELSDANRRLTLWAEVSRALPLVSGLRAVYRLTYDGMRYDNTAIYYSPRDARLNALGLEFAYRYRSTFNLLARYLPAYAQERGFPARLAHELNVTGEWNLGAGFFIIPAYGYYTTPDYSVSRSYLKGEVRF